MIVFTQISTQIKCIQSIAVGEILAAYEKPLVFTELSGSGKKTIVGSYIQPVFIVRL